MDRVFLWLNGAMERLSAWVWGAPTMLLLLAVGLCMTVVTRGVQVRKLGASLRQVGRSVRAPAGKDGVSSFQAVCTALAATVGTGNIAGVAGAIALGGPGAVFWMWVSAFFGMATKYAEVFLALKFRRRDPDGQWLGGPMYYIRDGMGERWRWLAALFAFLTVVGSLGMGNIAQINTIAGAVVTAAESYRPHWTPGLVALATGGIVAALVALVTLGGAKRIGRVMERLVPVMAVLYVLGSVTVIALHWRNLGAVCAAIFHGAFRPQAVLGGAAGIGLRQAVRWGVSRGIFSNEAGLGSAPIAHAAAEATPEEQGLFGIFEVFLDTVVLCTLTAVTILISGIPIPYGQSAGAELATAALETAFGPWAAGFSALSLSLLALATLISWNLYGVRCAQYLWGERGAGFYRVAYVLVILAGATMDLSAAWSLADALNGLMALPNLAALLALLPVVRREMEGNDDMHLEEHEGLPVTDTKP